jgi:hypothetical protein
MAEGHAASRKTKVVAAIQWAVVGYSATTPLWKAVSDYYFFVRDGFSVGIPDPFGMALYALVVASIPGGLVGGYVWAGRRADSAESERREHRRRVAFLFVLLSLGVASLVARMVVSGLLGDRFFTVPYFLASPVLDLLALAGAYALVYRAGVDFTDVGGSPTDAVTRDETTPGGTTPDGTYRPSLAAGAVGGVQWAVTALYLGFAAFGIIGEYLLRTRQSVDLQLGLPFVAAVLAAFVVGYVRVRRPTTSAEAAQSAHRRRVEYVLAVFGFAFVLSILFGVAMMVFPSLAFGLSTLLFSAAVGLALVLASLSVYVADFDLLGRLLST